MNDTILHHLIDVDAARVRNLKRLASHRPEMHPRCHGLLTTIEEFKQEISELAAGPQGWVPVLTRLNEIGKEVTMLSNDILSG